MKELSCFGGGGAENEEIKSDINIRIKYLAKEATEIFKSFYTLHTTSKMLWIWAV